MWWLPHAGRPGLLGDSTQRDRVQPGNAHHDGAGSQGQDPGPVWGGMTARAVCPPAGGTPRQALEAHSCLTSPRPWGPRSSQSPGLWLCPAPPEPLLTLRPLPGMRLLGEPVRETSASLSTQRVCGLRPGDTVTQ